MSSQPSPKDEATSYLDDAPTSDESVDGGVALRDGQRASSIDSPSNPEIPAAPPTSEVSEVETPQISSQSGNGSSTAVDGGLLAPPIAQRTQPNRSGPQVRQTSVQQRLARGGGVRLNSQHHSPANGDVGLNGQRDRPVNGDVGLNGQRDRPVNGGVRIYSQPSQVDEASHSSSSDESPS